MHQGANECFCCSRWKLVWLLDSANMTVKAHEVNSQPMAMVSDRQWFDWRTRLVSGVRNLAGYRYL
jgi:hypothetical protein